MPLNPRSWTSHNWLQRYEKTDFAFKNVPDEEFCNLTRITKNGMLTYASLLMFGKRESIMEHIDNFLVDYIEIPGKVTFESDIDSSTVTYFRPQLGGSHGGSTDPKTDPKKNDMGNKIISIIRSSPNITKEEIANLCGMSVSGVKYHLEKLKRSGKIA